jgi:hypothetical protein
MNNTLNTNLNGLYQHKTPCNTKQSENTQNNITSSYMPTLVKQKQLIDYNITIFSDKQLNLVSNFILNNNYQDLTELLNNDKNILPKLIVLPKEQSLIITAIIKKKHDCAEVLCNAILKYAKKKSIPQYLQQYLFIFACENFDTDNSKSIVELYKNTSINLTSEQIILLLNKSIHENNLQLSQLLITKFITQYDNTIKNKKYAELVKCAIQMNQPQTFNALLNLEKHNQIDTFNKEILKNIILDLIKSNNISLLDTFLIKAISMHNKNILFDVVYFFILYGGQSFDNISLIFDIITKNPYLLLIKNKDNTTILHAAFHKKSPNYVLELLKNPILKEHINNPFYYSSIKHKSKYDIAEIALTNCRNAQYKNKPLRITNVKPLKKFSCMHKLTINRKYQQNKSVDYLDLATLGLEQKAQTIFTEIINNIADISCLGIYLYTKLLMKQNKNNGQYYSFGDENATINIINRLIFLGCRNINLYIPFIENIDENTINIIINKIACLLNIKIKDTNHIIKKAQCAIKFCFINKDEYACIPDDIVLTFNAFPLFESIKNVKKAISLRPFLFSKSFEEMFIKNTNDENDPNYKILTLNNPVYSILKEEKDSLPLSYGAISDNRKWYYDLLTQTLKASKANLIVNCITTIAKNIQTINHGLIYGLHHHDIHNKEDILGNWINLLKISSHQNDKKPIVLSIPVNTLSLNIKKFSTRDTIIFDLINKEYKLSVIEKAFKQKNHIIILYPNLPKVIFYHLIDKANIPILIEGANTTSYALQTAKPYLSLLPSGETPIPQTMGDSLQALLMEATSYKITMNPEYLALTKKIFDLAKQERYQDAINLIYDLEKNSNQNKEIQLFFRYCTNKDSTYKHTMQYKDKISILFLLYKGKSLSVFGKEYLLQILNPDMQSVADYIQKCTELDSRTAWHFKLMQQHVNLEINNTIDFSLYKLFKN